MDRDKILNYIEDKKVDINNKWYYHAMPFSKDNYINALNNGILSPYLMQESNSLYKYVFVSKANNDKYSAFTNYSIYPSFIISDKILAIKYDDNYIKRFIYGGFHGIKFTTLYKDEYQVYKKIKTEDIIGLVFNLDKIINNQDNENSLKILKEIVILLNELNLNIPIIDYYTKYEINKHKVLKYML